MATELRSAVSSSDSSCIGPAEGTLNENLVLASTGCNDVVINALMSSLQGYPCITDPLALGCRNEFHAGLEQAFGEHLVVDAEYIWKYTHGAYDFSVLGSAPITFPIEWQRSEIPGYGIPGKRSGLSWIHCACGHVQCSSEIL